MSDLISRRAAIDVLDKIFPTNPMRNDYTQGIACGAALATVYIKQLPSAQPKRGRWIVKGQDIYCSQCGNESAYNPFGASKFSLYCPNCGARMEEDDGTD